MYYNIQLDVIILSNLDDALIVVVNIKALMLMLL